MYWVIGNYSHPANQIDLTSFSVQRLYSPRNQLYFMRKQLVLQGHVIADGQDAIRTAINELEQAYKIQPGGTNGSLEVSRMDTGLMHDDGTRAAHFLVAADHINGIRLKHFEWSRSDGSEYATGRHFNIVLEADELNPESQIYSFAEQVQYIGNCETKWELVEQYYGPPQPQVIHEQTVQRIVQSGEAVGVEAHPFPPAEMFPEWKHGEQSYWSYGSPEVVGSNRYTMFPTRWRYVFSSPVKQNAYPHYDH